VKIEEFQKNGGINNFSEIFKSLSDISNICIKLIEDAKSVLKHEQQEDAMLRA
jgi:programmed cell death 6-interacting protein